MRSCLQARPDDARSSVSTVDRARGCQRRDDGAAGDSRRRRDNDRAARTPLALRWHRSVLQATTVRSGSMHRSSAGTRTRYSVSPSGIILALCCVWLSKRITLPRTLEKKKLPRFPSPARPLVWDAHLSSHRTLTANPEPVLMVRLPLPTHLIRNRIESQNLALTRQVFSNEGRLASCLRLAHAT